MSRSTQFIGLNKRAQKLIQGRKVLLYTEYIKRTYLDGKVEEFAKDIYGSDIKKEIGPNTAVGLFDEEINLNQYVFPTGEKYIEKVQHEIWSSGPMIFTALVDENDDWIEESLWTEEEMDCD